MTTMQERLVHEPRRSWLARLLDALLEPPVRVRRLDPRMLPPYLRRDMGLQDPADGRFRPHRPPAGW